MTYLILSTLNWLYSPELYCAIGGQIILMAWFYNSTWRSYMAVMRLKMIIDQLQPFEQKQAWLNAYLFLIDDVVFRLQFAPLMFHESPIPKGWNDLLMTAVLKRIKNTHPDSNWKWKRADNFCSRLLDAGDTRGDHC